MATATMMASLWSRCILLWCLAFLICPPQISCRIPEVRVTCRDTIDIKAHGFDSGLVISQLPERIPIYPNKDERCDMLLSIPTGFEMMFYFDWLDLYSSDRSRCDSTNVQFFDGSDNVAVKGLEQSVCGRMEEMPTSVYFVVNHYLLIRANSNGVVQGTGFRIHFTIYRRAFPCSREEFACESYGEYYRASGSNSGGNRISSGIDDTGGTLGARRCIAEELVCDDWNDCGDWVDEEQNCNTLSSGGIAAIVLVAVGLIALIVGLVIFCKIRREREMRLLSEKEAAVMRDTSFSSSRGFSSPFSISSETMEKEKYIPRYNTGRNSARRSQPGAKSPEYEERPPPYTEKPSVDDSRSEDDDPPRARRNRSRDADEVFEEEEEEEAPRMRRGRSQDDRYPPRDDRHPSRRDDQDSPRTDRYPRDRDDRYPDRDDRYPSRRDDRDRPPSRHDQRDRDRDRERPVSRPDDRESDRERPPSRHDERDRDRERPPSRHDDRDRDSRRDRPRSRHGRPEDRNSSEPEDDLMDQLHPLREVKRRSMHTDSDPDTSREERRTPQREDERYPPRDNRDHHPRDSDNRYPPRDDRDRRDRGRNDRPRDRDDRPRDRDDRPRDRDDRPRDRDDRPRDRDSRDPPRDDRPSRHDRPDRGRDAPSSRRPPPSRTPDDSYEDVPFPPPPPPLAEAEPDDSPPRNRRRRSRSRDGQDRPRSNRHPNDDRREEGQGRPRASQGGFREESV